MFLCFLWRKLNQSIEKTATIALLRPTPWHLHPFTSFHSHHTHYKWHGILEDCMFLGNDPFHPVCWHKLLIIFSFFLFPVIYYFLNKIFNIFMDIFLFFLKNFYCYSVTVVCLFSPSLHPTPAEPTSLPHLHPAPWFCPCVLYSSSCNPLFPLSPPHSPLAIVRLFLTSMSLVVCCFLFSSIA